MAVLQQVGGLEIAGMAGFLMEVETVGLAVVLVGYIVTVAALLAFKISPESRRAMFFSHASEDEPCGPRVLAALGGTSPLAAHLRLGEGTGALVAWPLLRAAAALMNTGHEVAAEPSDTMMAMMGRLDPEYMAGMAAKL